ncbi:hypothetical protein TNCT_591721 [Trichonephila clavata]|uniref:Uncharacterized protein n=1 Tax=Trichonephila clavata TaxID=2740835 RepID=A0A8X6FGI1_TRICU|nr:hypothetical protein TNCT_591721 [Trichonephila clavata]
MGKDTKIITAKSLPAINEQQNPSSAEDLDLNDFAKFQRRMKFCAKLFKELKSRFRKEHLGLFSQKCSKPISHKIKVAEIVLVENPNKKRLLPVEIQPEELPIAAVGMEKVPEPSTLSEVPVAYTDQEVNPELTEVTPAMDSYMEVAQLTTIEKLIAGSKQRENNDGGIV